jgi:hypothetical protein
MLGEERRVSSEATTHERQSDRDALSPTPPKLDRLAFSPGYEREPGAEEDTRLS